MTLHAQRPLAILLALAFTLTLWAPTVSGEGSSPSIGRAVAADHVVFAAAPSIVLM